MGRSQYYQLCLDSSIEEPAECAKLVAKLARRAYPKAPLAPTPEKPKAK